MKRILLASSMLATVLAGAVSPAHAYVYSLSDEYWMKAGTAFSTVFAGAAGAAGTQGIYQETVTGGSPVITQLTTTNFITTGTTNRFANAPLTGEFTQNDSGSGIVLNGWQTNIFKTAGTGAISTFQVNNGGTGAAGAETGALNVVNPGLNGTGLNFQYETGATGGILASGATSLFTLNSMQIDSNATASAFIIEGLLNGVVVDSAMVSYNFVGGFVTFTPVGWTNIDEVALTDGNWTAGTMSIRNIDITSAVAAVPEPMTLAILGVGLLGLGVIHRRKTA